MSQYLPTIRAMGMCTVAGVMDSLRLPSTLIFFLSSVTVRVRSAHCLLLNGLIFLGSILLADYVWAPLIRTILQLSVGGDAIQLGDSSMPLASASIPLPSDSEGNNAAAWLNVIFLYAYQVSEGEQRERRMREQTTKQRAERQDVDPRVILRASSWFPNAAAVDLSAVRHQLHLECDLVSRYRW
jgi:hypothetical protein